MGELALFADDLVSEDDLDFPLTGVSRHRLEAGFFGMTGAGDGDLVLDLAHQEQQPHDHEGPQQQDDEQEQLVTGHGPQSFIR